MATRDFNTRINSKVTIDAIQSWLLTQLSQALKLERSEGWLVSKIAHHVTPN
jgi:hypothetical protein